VTVPDNGKELCIVRQELKLYI